MKQRYKTASVRLLAMMAASVIAIVASIALASAPVQAHSLSSAVTNGCGSDYNYVSGTLEGVVSTTSSAVYGYVGLAKAGGSKYCVFAYKSSSHEGHGVRTRMTICYTNYSRGLGACDAGNFSHWMTLHFTLGFREGVNYSSGIHHPSPGYRAEGSGSHIKPDPF